MADTIPGYVNVNQAVEILGHKERSTVLHLIKDGKLKIYRVTPKTTLIELASLEEYKAKRRTYTRKAR